MFIIEIRFVLSGHGLTHRDAEGAVSYRLRYIYTQKNGGKLRRFYLSLFANELDSCSFFAVNLNVGKCRNANQINADWC